MLMYRDEICHIKGGVGDRVISTKGARLNKGVGAILSWNAVRPCVNKCLGCMGCKGSNAVQSRIIVRGRCALQFEGKFK